MHLVSLDTKTGRLNRYATKPGAKPVFDSAAAVENLDDFRAERLTGLEDNIQIFRKTGNVA